MSVFSDIDSLDRQVTMLIAESKKPAFTPPPPPPPPKDDKKPVELKIDTSTEESSPKSSTTSEPESAGGDPASSESSDTTTAVTTAGGENTFTGTLKAAGQTLTKSFNEQVLPELKKVNPKVYWGLGIGTVVLIVINQNRN